MKSKLVEFITLTTSYACTIAFLIIFVHWYAGFDYVYVYEFNLLLRGVEFTFIVLCTVTQPFLIAKTLKTFIDYKRCKKCST